MKRNILLVASVLGALSVLIGAMGAHFFEDYLISIDRVETFQTAIRYQFYHILLLLSLGLLFDVLPSKMIKCAFYCCLFGILFFSGSLYLLCVTNNTIFGIITPIGGLLLVLSWLLLIVAIIQVKKI